MKTVVFLSIPNGQSIRDFIVLGGLSSLIKTIPEAKIYLLSPSYNVPQFIALLKEYPEVQTLRMECPTSTGTNSRIVKYRKRMQNSLIKNILYKWETKRFEVKEYIIECFDKYKPDLFISTHPMTAFEYEWSIAASVNKVKIVAILKSWDNLLKGLTVMPDYLSVWNLTNYSEAIASGFNKCQVAINGAISFDPFFIQKNNNLREKLCKVYKIPNCHKIISFATSGVYDLGYYYRDETHLLEETIKILEKSNYSNKFAIIVRLHPMSKYLDFKWMFDKYSFLRISHGSSMPQSGWYTDKSDYQDQINLLGGSDLIITPCSSWTLESAIFNTPVLCPVYSTRQPNHAYEQFDKYTLAKHFKPLKERNLVKLIRNVKELRKNIIEALDDPDVFEEERQKIIKKYIHFEDGNSAARISLWIKEILN